MAEMIDDSFANYVVQTALDYAEGDQRAQLIQEIMPLLGTIKSRSWYKRIMTKIGLGISSNGAAGTASHYDTGRLPPRQYMDEGQHHQRMGSDRGLGSMHGYGQIHGSERSAVEHLPPGFMHGPPSAGHMSDRPVYRSQHHPAMQNHSQAPQQYGNFYPYGPRAPLHHSDYRTNGEY